MSIVYLVYGFLGSGKTTFSHQLAQQHAAIRFSIDEWYLRIFADSATHELDSIYWKRLTDALNELWPQVAKRGIDVVLDFGFWSRDLRDEVRSLAHSVGAETRLYWVQCPDAVALERCLARNGTSGSFVISEEGFQEMKQRFESLGPDEEFEAVE